MDAPGCLRIILVGEDIFASRDSYFVFEMGVTPVGDWVGNLKFRSIRKGNFSSAPLDYVNRNAPLTPNIMLRSLRFYDAPEA